MRTIAAIDMLRERGEWFAADVLLRAYEDVMADRIPQFSTGEHITINGLQFKVWEVGDEIINSYAEYIRLAMLNLAREHNKVTASVVTVTGRTRC